MNRSLTVTSGNKVIFSCIQNKTTSRINAIKTLSDYFSIFIEEILYFGVGPNDLEIFKMLSNCVAIGNCLPELIKYTLNKTKSWFRDSVKEFIFEISKILLI